MRTIIEAVEGEYRRYKGLAEGAFKQVADAQLSEGPEEGNSIVIIVWHIAGNLRSRFTDFLTADGEKPWRDRESEFDARNVTRAEMLSKWEEGWNVLFESLRSLSDDDLNRTITIRNEKLSVIQSLQRRVTHTSYHVGQIVFLAKSLAGGGWKSLTIPRKRPLTSS